MGFNVITLLPFVEFPCGEAKPKISFPFLFPLRGGCGGRRRKEKGKEMFGFARASPRACPRRIVVASPRNRGVRRGLEPPRAPRVRLVLSFKKSSSKCYNNTTKRNVCEIRNAGRFLQSKKRAVCPDSALGGADEIP